MLLFLEVLKCLPQQAMGKVYNYNPTVRIIANAIATIKLFREQVAPQPQRIWAYFTYGSKWQVEPYENYFERETGQCPKRIVPQP